MIAFIYFGITDHAIAAIMFCSVHGSIGKFDQVALELRIRVIDSHTDADCEMLNLARGAGKKFGLLHCTPQALGHI